MTRSVSMQPLGRTYFVQGCIRGSNYFAECDDLTFGSDKTEADAIALLEQHGDAEAIYEASEECGYFRNVSREIAEVWMNKLADSFDPDHDEWPAFIQRHVSPLLLEEAEADIRAEISHHRAHVRSFSAPA